MPDSGKAYLGDVPLLKEEEEPIFIDGNTGKKYYEEDCHIFVAKDKPINLPIPNGTSPIFVAVDGEEKDYATEVKGNNFANSTIHAIFDWNNADSQKQLWFSDILQFGSRSTGDEPDGYTNPPALPSGRIPNQLKSGKGAFYFMKKNPKAISNLDVSNVKTMLSMFEEATPFNQDISEWDTSKVTNMKNMFMSASSFNQDIGNWNVSEVTDMDSMFRYGYDFNQDIGNWNTSKVTNMKSMFYAASSFNQPIGNWDTSNVTDMGAMFQTSAFNQPIGNWNTSKVTNMEYMFNQSSFSQDISKWDTSNVKSMRTMFGKLSTFNQPIGNWDTSSVENMYFMFQDATSFNQDLSQWCVINVTNHDYFDYGATAWANSKKPKWGTCPRGEDKN